MDRDSIRINHTNKVFVHLSGSPVFVGRILVINGKKIFRPATVLGEMIKPLVLMKMGNFLLETRGGVKARSFDNLVCRKCGVNLKIGPDKNSRIGNCFVAWCPECNGWRHVYAIGKREVENLCQLRLDQLLTICKRKQKTVSNKTACT